MIPEVGDKKTFLPAAWFALDTPEKIRAEAVVTGTVVQVNLDHRWFRVRYETRGGYVGYECFKF